MSVLKPKILFVIGSLDVGGAERHLVQVLPPLAERGFDLAVFTVTHKGKQSPGLEALGVRVVEPWFAESLRGLPSQLRKLLLLCSAAVTYAWFLLRWRPDIVHFFLPIAYMLGGFCSLLLGQRVLVMSRRSLNGYQNKYPILARFEKRLHKSMNAVLGNSVAVVDQLRDEGIEGSRLGLLYNGIDLAQFDRLPPKSLIRKKLGVEDETYLMVCVANLIPYKGHADLIRALGSIHQSLPRDWAIAMVGRDAGIKNDLIRLAESFGIAGCIQWLGERSDTAAILSAGDIGVLCSHEEGFSNSVLEGMAAKLAMVVTDVGGNAEAILNGVCGIVVPARDPEALGKAILSLAKDYDSRARMGSSGSLRVRRRFSLESCVSQYAALYNALLYEPSGSVQSAIDSVNMKG